MQGISMNELYDVISNSHDVEFTYDGTMYMLQTEIDGENTFLVIWDCTPGSPKCIAKYCTKANNKGKEIINTFVLEVSKFIVL